MKIVKNKDKKLEEKMLSKIFNIFESDRGKEYPNKKDLLKYGYCIFLNAKNIQNNKLNFEIAEFITESKYNQLRGGKVEYNDIILTTRGTVGNVALNNQEQLLRLNSGMVALRCFKEYNINYLYFILKSNFFSKEIKKNISGGVLNQLPKNVIKKLKIKYTKKLEEQNKIANLLSEKEQHIENIKTLISKLEKRNEYYAEKLLSGELRVRENEKDEIEFYENKEWKEVKLNGRISKMPKDWQINKINEIFNIERGIVLSKEHILKNKGEYPVYSSATLNKGCIGYINTYTHESECLTWTTDGNYAGTVFYRNEKFTPTNICGVLSLKININFNVYYLHLIAKKEFPKMVNKVGNNKLMSNVVEKIELKYPNYIEQDKISYIIDIYEKEKELLENLLKKETKEFEWLSEKLLSGEYIIED